MRTVFVLPGVDTQGKPQNVEINFQPGTEATGTMWIDDITVEEIK
jgi:hypothetical protein